MAYTSIKNLVKIFLSICRKISRRPQLSYVKRGKKDVMTEKERLRKKKVRRFLYNTSVCARRCAFRFRRWSLASLTVGGIIYNTYTVDFYSAL